jgi:hypothetical protein
MRTRGVLFELAQNRARRNGRSVDEIDGNNNGTIPDI